MSAFERTLKSHLVSYRVVFDADIPFRRNRVHSTDAVYCYWSEVAWSVCLCVCVNAAKRPNQSRCRSTPDSCGPREPRGAHRRHLVNTMDRDLCGGGDVACRCHYCSNSFGSCLKAISHRHAWHEKTALSVSRPIRHYKIDLMQFENRELTYRVGQKSGATNSWP